jgi:hypothetical protein
MTVSDAGDGNREVTAYWIPRWSLPSGSPKALAFRVAGLLLANSMAGTLAKAAPKGEKTLANKKRQRRTH